MRTSFVGAPGTPRPGFVSETVRPTVYAPLVQENNQQLRDLLQRQQIQPNQQQLPPSQLNTNPQPQVLSNLAPSMINNNNLTAGTPLPQQAKQQPKQQQSIDSIIQQHSMQNQTDTGNPIQYNTFRQPLPPTMLNRPQRVVGHRFRAPGQTVIQQSSIGQQIISQQGQAIIHQHHLQQQTGVSHSQQQQFERIQPLVVDQQTLIAKENDVQIAQQTVSPNASVESLHEMIPGIDMVVQQQSSIQGSEVATTESHHPEPEIPDNVTAELEKLEDENAGMGEVEGVGDILGDLGEDDDDELLNSLTAEMGADFNILEYADPELDALNEGDQANLLDSLDFEEEPEKEKGKKDVIEKMTEELENKTNAEALPGTINIDNNRKNRSHIDRMNKDESATSQLNLVDDSHRNLSQTLPTVLQHTQQPPQRQIQQQPPITMNHQQPNTQQALQTQAHPSHYNNNNNHQMNQMSQAKSVNPSTSLTPQQHMHLIQIQQQMQNQVQQAANSGRPMAIGTQLMSKDGSIIGVVMENNTVKINIQHYNRSG